MATIKDVAQRAQVAPSTISKYMNGGNVRPEHAEAIAASGLPFETYLSGWKLELYDYLLHHAMN